MSEPTPLKELIAEWEAEIVEFATKDDAYYNGVRQCLDDLKAITQADPAPAARPQDGPKIICLCGSTKFIEKFAIKTWELEREGAIVLGCTLLPNWYCPVPSHFGEKTGTKAQCDELHLRKIDLADEVLVLNIGGYIGESTRNEIAYATKTGKPVSYIEPLTETRPPV